MHEHYKMVIARCTSCGRFMFVTCLCVRSIDVRIFSQPLHNFLRLLSSLQLLLMTSSWFVQPLSLCVRHICRAHEAEAEHTPYVLHYTHLLVTWLPFLTGDDGGSKENPGPERGGRECITEGISANRQLPKEDQYSDGPPPDPSTTARACVTL